MWENFISFLSNIPCGIFCYEADEEKKILFTNRGVWDLYGCANEEEFRKLTGYRFPGMVHPSDLERVQREIWQQVEVDGDDRVEYRIIRKDGSILWTVDCGRLVEEEDGRRLFYVVLLDMDELINRERHFRQRAQVDSLVGVYNRSTALEVIRTQLETPAKHGHHMLLVVDIDNFKQINDLYGHPEGDRVLVQLAKTLRSSFRPNDVIGRLGGDEFIVFLYDVKSVEQIVKRVEYLCTHAMEGQENNPVKVSFSVGIACSKGEGETFDQLYDRADKALYRAKRGGKCRLYML